MQDINKNVSQELRLSVSKVKCFAQCKKQFEFNYIKKFPKKERDYHVLGKFAHKVLEDFHLFFLNGGNESYHKVMGDSFKAALKEFVLTPEMKKECWDMINQYLKIVTEDKKNNLAAEVIACEKNFSIKIADNVVLNGMIDRIQIDQDGVLHVADYKTSKQKKYLKNDFFQLLTYAFVLLEEDKSIEKIRASYIMMRHNFEYITTEFNAKEILAIKDQYLEYANAIFSETEYKPTTSILCSYCDFVDHCLEGRAKAGERNIILTHGESTW